MSIAFIQSFAVQIPNGVSAMPIVEIVAEGGASNPAL
jgi:hypothetical protein